MFSDTIHGHKSYGSKDILVGVKFIDMVTYSPNGSIVVDYQFFDATNSLNKSQIQWSTNTASYMFFHMITYFIEGVFLVES